MFKAIFPLLLIPSFAFGRLPSGFAQRISAMLRPGIDEYVKIAPAQTVNRRIWITDHLETRGTSGIRIALDKDGKKRTHMLELLNVRRPAEVVQNPHWQQTFLDKATSVPGQSPNLINGSWDVIQIRPERLMSGVSPSVKNTMGHMQFNRREVSVFEDVNGELFFQARPIDASWGGSKTFGVAAMTLTVADLAGISQVDARDIVINEFLLLVYPPVGLDGNPNPIAVQVWDTSRWYVLPLLEEILDHPSIAQTLEQQNDTLHEFLAFLARHGVDFSGTFSGLPADLFMSFADEHLSGTVSYLHNGIVAAYDVIARSPSDILQFVSANVDVPIQFNLGWVSDDISAPPFIDADIVQNKPLIPEGGSYNALYRSHTVPEGGGTFKFSIGENLQFALLAIFNDGHPTHTATLYGSDANPRTRTISGGPQLLFNNLSGDRGYWIITTDGACEVQIYTGCVLSGLDNHGTTRLEWPDDRGTPIHVYGQLDRSHRRNTFYVTGRLGEALSVAAHPFRAVIGSLDYNVLITLSKADIPFVTPLVASPTMTIPQTVIQSYPLPQTSEFWQIDVTTEHAVKDLEYMLTVTAGALSVQGYHIPLAGRGVVGRVER